jgi:2'-5' RNA ligase
VEALKAIELPKFELRFKGIGAFPSLNRINVVWVGVAVWIREGDGAAI